MRNVFKMATLVAILGLVAGESTGQEKGQGGRGAGSTAAGLILNGSVQKELKLSDEQIEKAKKAAEEILSDAKDDFKKFKDATPEERSEMVQKISDKAHKALNDVLKPEQIKRLKQIELQQRGLGDTNSQKALKVTDEQKEKLKKIGEETAEKRREIAKESKGDFKAMQEKMSTLRKDEREKQSAVLTDEQKKQWKEMTGEPFEVRFEFRKKD
jgi:hypothetical protein